MHKIIAFEYNTMYQAVEEALALDEVRDIWDKARAVQVYAQQTNNKEAEAKAAQIRLRAERRCSELLRGAEISKGEQLEETPDQPDIGLCAAILKKDPNRNRSSCGWQIMLSPDISQMRSRPRWPFEPSRNLSSLERTPGYSAPSENSLTVQITPRSSRRFMNPD